MRNTLKTNGPLIDDDWAAFLAAEGFLVGLSLDGHAQSTILDDLTSARPFFVR